MIQGGASVDALMETHVDVTMRVVCALCSVCVACVVCVCVCVCVCGMCGVCVCGMCGVCVCVYGMCACAIEMYA